MRFTPYIICLLLSTSLLSCLEIGNQIVDWTLAEEGDMVFEGEYHILEEDGIRIFLPEVFERYSMAEYQQVVKKLLSEGDYNKYLGELELKRNAGGQLYIYFDDESRSTLTVNTTKFEPMSKNDAQQLLGYIRIGNEKELAVDEEFTKVSAKYLGIPEDYVFKSVHKIHSPKTDTEYFTSVYIVSRNNKTVIYHLLTGSDVYFDPFVEKIEVR